MADREHEEAARAFFSSMNAQDADAAAALVSEDVEIRIGSHRLDGRAAVRMLAVQTDERLVFETVPTDFEAETPSEITSFAVRKSRWRDSGEPAAEEQLTARFAFDDDGLISRIALA